jgi:hypothetical protein
MPQVVTAGPANGWYGSSIFGSGGFGGAGNGGSFPNQMGGSPNQFGGGFSTPIQSAWGNETFVPPAWGSGANAGTGLPGSSPFPQSSPNYGSPQSYIPSSSGYGTLTVLGQGGGGSFPGGGSSAFGGGSALSGGFGAPSSPGSVGGGSPYGSGGGFLDGGALFSGGGGGSSTPFNAGQAPQSSALSGSFDSGGSISPQSLAMAESMGLSPAQAQAFGQQQQQQQVNPADLPSQNAGEMMGNLGGGFSNPYTLAQVIQSEAGDSQAGQFAVAAVLANRAANPTFAQYGDLLGQANAPGQFAGHLNSPSGPGRIVPQSQVGASAQEIAQALQNGTLGNMGQLGNALYFLAQTSPDGARMAASGGAPLGGGTAATNNVFSNRLGYTPAPGFVPPQYTLGNFAQEAADPFGTAYGRVPFGQMAANLSSAGFPILQSGANGYGYPAAGASTMSDALLGNMGFNTNSDYTSQLLDQAGIPTGGYGGGSVPDPGYYYGADAGVSGYGVPVYTYGNDLGINTSDYSNIGGYAPSYGPDFGSGGVTDLGTDTSGAFDFSGGGSMDMSGGSFDSSGGGGGY